MEKPRRIRSPPAQGPRISCSPQGEAYGATCRGDRWDNAPAERFFSTLKLELAYLTHWPTRQDARDDVHEYIEVFYNRRRRRSSIGYCTPVDAEDDYARAVKRLSKERT